MKNLVSLLLIFLFFFFSFGVLEAKSTNITGAVQNGNVFTVTPSHKNASGTTGFRQYSNFTLDQNHILNLQFQNNMNRFVNIVNNSVTINGILNTVKDGNFYNGNVVFITRGGFTVGANGVLNLGSLNVYARTVANPNIDTLSQMTDEALATELNSYKNACAANITINGRIFAKDEVNFYSNNFVQGANSSIIVGFDDSKIQNGNTQVGIAKEITAQNALNKAIAISDIINTGKFKNLENNYNFSAKNGKIQIVSKDISIQGTIKSGNDIKISQTGGRNFNINGNIETKNNLNIIKIEGAYEIGINNYANLLAENKLNIFNEGTGRIVVRNGSIINGYDVNLIQQNGQNLEISGIINTSHDLNIIKNTNYDILISNTAVLNSGNEMNLVNNGAGRIIIQGNGILNGYDININQKSGGHLDILGKIDAKNNITITKTGGNNINIKNKINAGNNLKINSSETSSILIDSDVIAKNINFISDSTGNITINGNLNANDLINIEKNNVGQIILNANSKLEASDVNLTQNTASEMLVNGNIVANNDVTLKSTGSGNLTINGNLNANDLINIEKNNVGQIILNANSKLEASDVNLTQNTASEMFITGRIITNNDINLKCLNSVSGIRINSQANLNAKGKLDIDTSNKLIVAGETNGQTIDIICSYFYLSGGKLIADNDITINNISENNWTGINGTISVLKEGNVTLNTNTWLGFYDNDITNINIKKGNLYINALKGNADEHNNIRPAGVINLDDGNIVINSSTGVTLGTKTVTANNLEVNNSSDYQTTLSRNVNLKNDLKINNTGNGSIRIKNATISNNGSVELNANNNISISNSNLDTQKDIKVSETNGQLSIYNNDIDINNGNLIINKVDNTTSQIANNSVTINNTNLNVKNGKIDIKNNSPKQLVITNNNIAANDLNILNENTLNTDDTLNNIYISGTMDIKNDTTITNNGYGSILLRSGTELKSGNHLEIVNNENGKNLNINNTQISANNDVTLINNGKGNTTFRNSSNISSSKGDVSIINGENAGYIKLEDGNISAMDWVTVSNKKNGQVYINGDFELLPDGTVKFTPKVKFISKNNKYRIQDYLYDISQSENGLLVITLEELKSIGVETQKLLNEKKISEKINLLELCKLTQILF